MANLRNKTKAAVRHAISFQETEDTGRPRMLSKDERKRAGAEVTRVARDLGVGGKFTAPAGLDEDGLNQWHDASIAALHKKAKK